MRWWKLLAPINPLGKDNTPELDDASMDNVIPNYTISSKNKV
jgi:hypothetical protein